MNKLQSAFEAGEDPLADLTDLLDYDINSIAGLLKLYLRKLEEKLIPGNGMTEKRLKFMVILVLTELYGILIVPPEAGLAHLKIFLSYKVIQ